MQKYIYIYIINKEVLTALGACASEGVNQK